MATTAKKTKPTRRATKSAQTKNTIAHTAEKAATKKPRSTRQATAKHAEQTKKTTARTAEKAATKKPRSTRQATAKHTEQTKKTTARTADRPTAAKTKSTRWNLRVAQVADDAVRKAAHASNRNLTEFIELAAVIEAERVLADRTRFVLDTDQWLRFVALLDRPPQDNPRLAKLFAKPSVFV